METKFSSSPLLVFMVFMGVYVFGGYCKFLYCAWW